MRNQTRMRHFAVRHANHEDRFVPFVASWFTLP
jgi:hypothetical protein